MTPVLARFYPSQPVIYFPRLLNYTLCRSCVLRTFGSAHGTLTVTVCATDLHGSLFTYVVPRDTVYYYFTAPFPHTPSPFTAVRLIYTNALYHLCCCVGSAFPFVYLTFGYCCTLHWFDAVPHPLQHQLTCPNTPSGFYRCPLVRVRRVPRTIPLVYSIYYRYAPLPCGCRRCYGYVYVTDHV